MGGWQEMLTSNCVCARVCVRVRGVGVHRDSRMQM